MKSQTLVIKMMRQNIFFRFYKHYIFDSLVMIKQDGFKTFARKRGKKVIGIVIAYYLVRDTLLYVILPFLVARGLF